MVLPGHSPLWNHAAIRVLDIRQSAVPQGETMSVPRMPASSILLVNGGRGQVELDDCCHNVSDRYVCHAGKGASLRIAQVEEIVHYYLIYYKASPVLPCRQELLRLYERDNPFQSQFGFCPPYPLGLYTKIEHMHRQWQLDGALAKFHVRALFHQFLYEMLQQLDDSGGGMIRPDVVSQAIRFFEERYAEPLNLQQIAAALQCGARQLQRQFKTRLRIGPMEYVIQIRMQRAQELLLHTQASLREIAEATGYMDSYYFSRAFKKYCGVAPDHYRRSCRTSSSAKTPLSIGYTDALSYSGIDNEKHYQYKGEGDFQVRHTKTTIAVSLMLSFMLLMGACTGNVSSNSNNSGAGNAASGSGAPVSAVQANSASAGAAEEAQSNYPVTIKHLKGEYTLNKKPEKIAVLDTKFVDQLVTLQELPTGSVTAAGSATDFPEYLAEKLEGVKVLGTRDEPNLEAIIEMDPDIIVMTGIQEKVYDSLSKIAPTIMFDFDEDWRDTLVTFGQIVGQPEQASAVIQAYEDKTARLKQELADKLQGESVALLRPRDDMIRVHTPGHRTGAILYNDLGLTVPGPVAEDADTAFHISLEALADIGADHYFLLTDDMFKGVVDKFQSTTTWSHLDAVKNDRVYTVDTTLWIAYYGPIAINMIVDQIEQALLGGH